MDCSLPGSSIHGIFQARVLEWGAITFSAGLGWGYSLGSAVPKIILVGQLGLKCTLARASF